MGNSFVRIGGGHSVPLKYRKNARAKRLSLRLSPKDTSFVLTVPPRATPSQIEAFLNQCRPWAEKQFQKIAQTLSIQPGKSLLVHGIEYECVTDPLRKKPVFCQASQALHLPSRYVQKDLHELFKRVAEEVLSPYVLRAAQHMGQRVKKITIRDTKSRWGSCSAQKAISLNWRLILAPKEVACYVCIHEAVHLTHMNHSQAFWGKVEELCPSYRMHQKWLKAHGPSLMCV